jgi:transcriptional regulator with XRE-family HTH domain
VPALRYWRTQRALRQTELAERADVGIMSVHRGETGQPLQLATVRRLAEALEVKPADLMAQPPSEP